jgi:hypothetical protein
MDEVINASDFIDRPLGHVRPADELGSLAVVGCRKYSSEVPQPRRNPADFGGRRWKDCKC